MNAKAPQPNPGRKPAPPSPPPPPKWGIEIHVANEFILTKEQYEEIMKKIDDKQSCICEPIIIAGEALRKAVRRMKNETGGGKP